MPELFCPNCKKPLRVLYDDRHDETYCKCCGIILRCPPQPEIFTPDVIRDRDFGKKSIN